MDTLFAGPGDIRARCRALDWAATPLGPTAAWPLALRGAVRLCLDAGFPSCVYAGDAFVMIYNEGFAVILDQKHPDVLGRPGREALPEIWDEVAADFARIHTTGEPVFRHDARYVLARGPGGAAIEGFYTFAFSPVRDDAGALVAINTVVTETTGRVLAERAFTGLMGASPAAMAVYSGPDHVVTYVNPAWSRLVGKPGAIGRSFREVFPEMAETGLAERLAQVYATGERYAVEEQRLPLQRHPGGPIEESYWSFVWQPVTLPDVTDLSGGASYGSSHAAPGGEPTASALGRDILLHAIEVTAQVRARREVERLLAESESARGEAEAARRSADEARRTAETANQAKAEFLAVMSHELRTPLNAIGGYAQLMELGLQGPVTPEQLTALRRIQRGQQHLLGLINSVLNYAKLEAGHVAYEPTDVPVAAVLAEVAALITPQIQSKGLRLLLSSNGAGADVVARADAEKLRQVILNLLSNAVKFSSAGGTVTMACAHASDGHVALTVADTGRGIAADQLSRVFEPFVQVDQRLTRTEQGTGLGLAISRDLAREMGGDLTAESSPGIGSRFTLTLPRA